MLTIKPFVSRALRRTGFATDYRQRADRSWEIEPGCESKRLSAIFDEDDLKRITNTAPYTTLDFQVEQLRAGRYQHPARRAHLFRNAEMVDGHLFTMRMVHAMAFKRLPGFSTKPRLDIAGGALGTSEYGNKYFGHWLCDDISMSMTARQFGTVVGHVNSDNRLIGHQAAYAKLLDWDIRLLESAHFRELTILDWSPATPFHAERFAALRNKLPIEQPSRPNRGVLLLRHSSGQRRILANESAIAELVRDRGFHVIDPMTSSVEDLVKVCSHARVVMGVEGSQLAHGFLPMATPGGTMLTLQPPFKFDNFWKSRCDCVGSRYAFIVGTQVDEAGFTVEVDQVSRMLDRIEAVARLST